MRAALKKAEDEETLILRFFEWAGKESDIKLELPLGLNSAAETGLMKTPVASRAVQDGSVAVRAKPFAT